MDEKIDLLTKVTHYHESFATVKHEFNVIIAAIAQNDIATARTKFTTLYEFHFSDHFKFEELVVFPAILSWNDKTRYQEMVASYIRVHEYLLAQCATITELLSVVNPNGLDKEKATLLISVIGKLQLGAAKHIENETEHLVPLIAENVTLRFLTGRNVATFKEMLKRETVENKSVESASTEVEVDLSVFKLEVAKMLKR